MAFDAGTGVVHIVADTTGLNAQVASGTTGALARVKSAIASAGISGAFIAIGAAAAAGLAKAGASFVELASEVRTVQRATGLAAEDASRLLSVGHELGLDTAKVALAFGLLAKNIVNANASFTKYGIETQKANGQTRDFTAILSDIADKYIEVGGGIKGAALAQNIFGRSGRNLIPVLKQGSEGLAEMMAHADDLGVVLSQDDVDGAKAFSIAQHQLTEAVTGFSAAIGREVLPAMKGMVDFATFLVLKLQDIPAPLIAAVGGFAALTGAIALAIRVGAFFGRIWLPVITAIKGAAVAVYGYIAALVSLAITEGVVATATYVLETALIALEAAFPPLAIITLVGVAIGVLTGQINGLSDAIDEWLKTKVVPTIQAMQLMKEGGLTWAQAWAIVQARMQAAALSADDLNRALNGVDLGAILTPNTVSRLNAVMPMLSNVGDGVEALGGSFQSVEDAYANLITNAKANTGDLIAAFDQFKSAVAGVKQSIVDAFGGAAGALSEFLGKQNVTADALFKNLADYKRQLSSWEGYFTKIHSLAGKASDQFLEDMQKQGLKSIGIMQAVADMPKKQRDEFIKNYNAVNAQTESVAGTITNKLIPALQNMTDKLRNAIRIASGHHPIDFDTTRAMAKLDALIAKLGSLPGGGVGVGAGGSHVNPNGTNTGPTDPSGPGRRNNGQTTRFRGRDKVHIVIDDWRTGVGHLDEEMAWSDPRR